MTVLRFPVRSSTTPGLVYKPARGRDVLRSWFGGFVATAAAGAALAVAIAVVVSVILGAFR